MIGRRPMKRWMPKDLPALSSIKLIFGSLNSTGLSFRISNLVSPTLPTTCSGGMPYTCSVKTRMKLLPPPETMKVLKPLAPQVREEPDALFPRGGDSLHVVLEDSFPLRVPGRERLHAVEGDESLEIHRLLAPERAVVVERRDARFCSDVPGAAALGHRLDELHDRVLDVAVVPRRQRIRRPRGGRLKDPLFKWGRAGVQFRRTPRE